MPLTPPNGIIAQAASDSVTALTDNSGGTAADTIAVIGATYDQAEVRNATASNTAKINEIIAALKASGIMKS